MPFTAEELAEMAAADAEIEASFHLTNEDLARSRAMDREAVVASMPPEKRKLAAQQKAYYEANRAVNRSAAYAIKTARRARRYTQKDLAQMLGVSQAAISMWETGAVTPDVDKLAAVFPELAYKKRSFEANRGGQ